MRNKPAKPAKSGMWKVLKERRVRREPGASPSSLFVAAIVEARVGDVLGRRRRGRDANFSSADQWVSSTLAAIGRR